VTPKRRDGPVEQMRVLLVARRSARRQRIATLNQLRQVVICAPDEIRVRFKDRYKTGLVTEAARMRPRKGSDPVSYTTNAVIRDLARRIKSLNTEMHGTIVGASVRCHADPRRVGEDERPGPPQPWRGSTGERCALPNRIDPHVIRRRDA
jgi:hypothetical protein